MADQNKQEPQQTDSPSPKLEVVDPVSIQSSHPSEECAEEVSNQVSQDLVVEGLEPGYVDPDEDPISHLSRNDINAIDKAGESALDSGAMKGLFGRDDKDQKQKERAARKWFFGIWAAVGVIVLVGVLIYLMDILAIPVAMIVWTVIFVFCLRGVVNFFERHHISRIWGTTFAYVIMVAVLVLLGLLLFSPVFGLSGQFESLTKNLPTYVDDINRWATSLYERYSQYLDNQTFHQAVVDIQNQLSNWATTLAQQAGNGIVSAGTVVVNSFIAIGFAFVMAFWILLELPQLGRECSRLVGPKRAEDARFFHVTFTRVMGGYIKALVIQCAVIAVGCGILFAIVRIPNPAALGAITGILNVIPIIGPWLGGIAAGVVGIFTSPLAAIVAVIGTIIVQQVVYTFVSPKIMADSVDVHPALTFVALMAGSAIGGAMGGLVGSLVGMLASIPAVAVMKSAFVYYFEKRTGRTIIAEDGVFFKGIPGNDEKIDPVHDATTPHIAPGETIDEARKRNLIDLLTPKKAKKAAEAHGSNEPVKAREATRPVASQEAKQPTTEQPAEPQVVNTSAEAHVVKTPAASQGADKPGTPQESQKPQKPEKSEE